MTEYRKIDGKFNVKLSTDSFDEPLRVKSVGGRRWAIAFSTVLGALALMGISAQLAESNKLKEKDIQIKKEQLDLARRQFVLDSIAATQNMKIR